MEKVSNFLKNLLCWTLMTIVNKAMYEILVYYKRSDVSTLWASNNPIEIIGTIVFGALLFSAHDWWLEKKLN